MVCQSPGCGDGGVTSVHPLPSYLGFVEQAVVVQEHLAFLASEPPQVSLKLLRKKRISGVKPNLLFSFCHVWMVEGSKS